MEEIKQRLESELTHTVQRLRQQGGAIAVEELPGGAGDSLPMTGDLDVSGDSEDREMSFATRSLLVERANKLAEALERLRTGEYGVCEECEEAIAPARLRAMPEVLTCVRCQDRRERTRRFEAAGTGVDHEESDDE